MKEHQSRVQSSMNNKLWTRGLKIPFELNPSSWLLFYENFTNVFQINSPSLQPLRPELLPPGTHDLYRHLSAFHPTTLTAAAASSTWTLGRGWEADELRPPTQAASLRSQVPSHYRPPHPLLPASPYPASQHPSLDEPFPSAGHEPSRFRWAGRRGPRQAGQAGGPALASATSVGRDAIAPWRQTDVQHGLPGDRESRFSPHGVQV